MDEILPPILKFSSFHALSAYCKHRDYNKQDIDNFLLQTVYKNHNFISYKFNLELLKTMPLTAHQEAMFIQLNILLMQDDKMPISETNGAFLHLASSIDPSNQLTNELLEININLNAQIINNPCQYLSDHYQDQNIDNLLTSPELQENLQYKLQIIKETLEESYYLLCNNTVDKYIKQTTLKSMYAAIKNIDSNLGILLKIYQSEIMQTNLYSIFANNLIFKNKKINSNRAKPDYAQTRKIIQDLINVDKKYMSLPHIFDYSNGYLTFIKSCGMNHIPEQLTHHNIEPIDIIDEISEHISQEIVQQNKEDEVSSSIINNILKKYGANINITILENLQNNDILTYIAPILIETFISINILNYTNFKELTPSAESRILNFTLIKDVRVATYMYTYKYINDHMQLRPIHKLADIQLSILMQNNIQIQKNILLYIAAHSHHKTFIRIFENNKSNFINDDYFKNLIILHLINNRININEYLCDEQKINEKLEDYSEIMNFLINKNNTNITLESIVNHDFTCTSLKRDLAPLFITDTFSSVQTIGILFNHLNHPYQIPASTIFSTCVHNQYLEINVLILKKSLAILSNFTENLDHGYIEVILLNIFNIIQFISNQNRNINHIYQEEIELIESTTEKIIQDKNINLLFINAMVEKNILHRIITICTYKNTEMYKKIIATFLKPLFLFRGHDNVKKYIDKYNENKINGIKITFLPTENAALNFYEPNIIVGILCLATGIKLTISCDEDLPPQITFAYTNPIQYIVNQIINKNIIPSEYETSILQCLAELNNNITCKEDISKQLMLITNNSEPSIDIKTIDYLYTTLIPHINTEKLINLLIHAIIKIPTAIQNLIINNSLYENIQSRINNNERLNYKHENNNIIHYLIELTCYHNNQNHMTTQSQTDNDTADHFIKKTSEIIKIIFDSEIQYNEHMLNADNIEKMKALKLDTPTTQPSTQYKRLRKN